MLKLFEFVEATAAADNLDQLYESFTQTIREIGYDRSIFSLMTDHAELKLNAGHGIMRNYPDGWMKHYVEHGMEKDDPVRCFMFRANGPFVWDELPMVHHYTPRQRAVMDGGYEAGLRSGAGVSMRNERGEIAGVGAANSAGDQLDPRAPHVLAMLSQHLYTRYSEMQARQHGPIDGPQLSDREREILSWLAIGKTAEDVAQIVGLSANGVRYHLNKIFDKLSVATQGAAIGKAVSRGMIAP